MNPTLALLALLTLTFHLFLSASADFHIVEESYYVASQNQNVTLWYACPSDKFNCDCLAKGKGGSRITGLSPYRDDRMFTIGKGFCRQRKSLNFIQSKENHSTVDIFLDGNPQRQGTCFYQTNPDATMNCKVYVHMFGSRGGFIQDRLVCITDICKS